MSETQTVLVVAATPKLSRHLECSVRSAGYRPLVVTTFAAAKRCLQCQPLPELVISEIKLAEHNGLHVAVRGQAVGIPAIVVGERVFEREAEQLGATWFSADDVESEGMHAAIARLIDLAHSPRTTAWYDNMLVPGATTDDAALGESATPGDPIPTLH